MSNTQANICAIILAGGQSSRFQYQDKGLIQWQGKALTQHAIEVLTPQVSHIIISCNRNMTDYAQWGLPCFSDLMSDFQGPLAGIQRGLKYAEDHHIAFCLSAPCDTPLLPKDLCERLYRQLSEYNADVAYVFDGERKQFLVTLMKTSVKNSLDTYLEQGERRVGVWLNNLKCIEVDFSDQKKAFANINDQESLQKLD